MSKENLEQFMNKVDDTEELQAKIGGEIDAEALIALGAECGCEFSADDLHEAAELSDDELDSIAGGIDAVVQESCLRYINDGGAGTTSFQIGNTSTMRRARTPRI